MVRIPFGLAYGILSIQAGLTVAETMLMSLVVFAGASQLMAVVMLQAGAGMPLVVASTLLVNLRHLMMGLSISPYLSETTPWWRRILAFAMTDESYLTSVTHYRQQEEPQGNTYFMLGSGGFIYVAWGRRRWSALSRVTRFTTRSGGGSTSRCRRRSSRCCFRRSSREGSRSW